ncbi:dinucleotide-utilizing enzyme [Microbacterium sp. CFH 31415]|uniref:dinucleotide-utilizing enzyme n=1 Tax=Microbacterium sp. CFH 31415 TaxID=2921732 RepID=UPI001F13A607|nr:dinucleotide-utilizing enzyme [Microbacterium sp. CFH 31415]MCH6229458.1 dinucleotide-utilizing enzyme [Microbacterium sp. CFH 31415]
MPTRPRLLRSIPFWALVVASLATAAYGSWLLLDKLGVMTTTLTDGTATGVEVYVGQSIAVVGGILLGAGVLGVMLALTVAAIATLRPYAPVDVAEPLAWTADDAVDAPAAGHGYERGLGYTSAIPTADVDARDDAAVTPPATTR